jgi:hypothetical protein
MQHNYNDHIIPHTFNKGDLVLYENQCNVNALLNEKGKFSPNWLGHYVTKENYGLGSYTLMEMNGTPIK